MLLANGQYLGSRRSKRSVASFQLSLHQYSQNEQLPLHAHENPYISLVLDGFYQESSKIGISTDKLVVNPKVLLYRPSGYQHANIFDKNGGSCFNIEFNDKSVLSRLFSNIDDVAIFQNNIEMTKVLNGFVNGYDDDVMQLLVEESIVAVNSREEALKKSNIVSKTIEVIEEEYSISFSLSHLSKRFGIHPVYLARKFKHEMNMTIGEYLLDVRLRKAFYSLKNREKKLTHVAYETGFYDQSHFSRNFKKTFDNKPGKIKKNLSRLI